MSGLFQEAIFVSLLAATIRIATPLLLSAMGELVTQRAGIWNVGVEGTMLTGAFIAYIAYAVSGDHLTAFALAISAAMVLGAITAFLSVTLRVDHFITGLGINLLASGLTLFWFRSFVKGKAQPTFDSIGTVPIPYLSDIPVIGSVLFDQRLLTYAAFALVPVVWAFLYRTRTGLELRALGENPAALDTMGLNVVARQYAATIFGSALTGLGGAFLMLGFSDRFVPELSAGRGWLVVVALIAGNWHPLRVTSAVLSFSFLESVATHSQAIGAAVPYQLLLALPYVISIAIIVMARGKSRQPAALGESYSRS
ncbi:ABC transporter permease [Aminobacter sp. SR38]|uniref:ABC transporter permease n=1 Tax=Aminobacter sp. SR38 TaxID=2774562 RepID=UPI00177E36C0|nr:ABC transporter permease [Aminobacter sp. SR38]QOF72241.1 ABC transporter permease [Aminobacter sp. SR38]